MKLIIRILTFPLFLISIFIFDAVLIYAFFKNPDKLVKRLERFSELLEDKNL